MHPQPQAAEPLGQETPGARREEPTVVGSTTRVETISTLWDSLSSATRVDVPQPKNLAHKELQPLDVLGNFQVLRLLAAGGMAEVYLARAALGDGVEKLVSLKLVRPEFGPDTAYGSMFLTEARVSATFQHPNVVQIYGYGELVGRTYLSMEHVEGRNLGEILERLLGLGRAAPISFAVAVAIAVSDALEYVHKKNDLDGRHLDLVHRDVTPGNILVTPRGEVKLVDFGVAARADDPAAEKHRVGKVKYMSPEQFRGERPMQWWDVYSLGVILHELLTMRRWTRDPSSDNLAPSPPPSVYNPNVPKALDDLVASTVHPDPNRRLMSARDLHRLLIGVQGKVGRCDVGGTVRNLFGEELDAEQGQIEEVVARARSTTKTGPFRPTPPILRFVRRVRRRLAALPFVKPLVDHPGAGAVVLALGLAATAIAGWNSWSHRRAERDLLRQLDLEAKSASAARLIGPGGDTALDHLLEAQKIAPRDPRVASRIADLASLFERLGDAAVERRDWAEAIVHFEAALQAHPGDAGLASKAAAVREQIRKATPLPSSIPLQAEVTP